MAKKALLLYSGGLDTSVMLKMLQERLGLDVVALTLDIGQEENDLKAIADKAWNLGAVDVVTRNVKEKFAQHYISREIRSDGMYGDVYPLSTSIARPLMSQEAVFYANEHDCDLIVHGCTGKGNDQVRFEVSIKALDNDLEVMAPIRDWGLNREVEMEYARENGIPVKKGGKYSTDENLWGRSVEGSDLEDPSSEVPEDAYSWVMAPGMVDGSHETLSLEFSSGIPVSINGKNMKLEDLVAALNSAAGSKGYGGIDYIEDRVTGIKSREFYECPGALTIISSHRALERITLNKEELMLKKVMDTKWADLTYSGLWFDPVMDHINQFENSINKPIDGTVYLKLGKGMCTVTGVESSNSLYNFRISTYGKEDVFDQSLAKGFIGIYGNQTVNTAMVRNKKLKELTTGRSTW